MRLVKIQFIIIFVLIGCTTAQNKRSNKFIKHQDWPIVKFSSDDFSFKNSNARSMTIVMPIIHFEKKYLNNNSTIFSQDSENVVSIRDNILKAQLEFFASNEIDLRIIHSNSFDLNSYTNLRNCFLKLRTKKSSDKIEINNAWQDCELLRNIRLDQTNDFIIITLFEGLIHINPPEVSEQIPGDSTFRKTSTCLMDELFPFSLILAPIVILLDEKDENNSHLIQTPPPLTKYYSLIHIAIYQKSNFKLLFYSFEKSYEDPRKWQNIYQKIKRLLSCA